MRYITSKKERTRKMIFDLQRASYVDGPGVRTTVFFKGCNLKCKWCHNPESQKFERQILFYKNKCTHCGKCAEVCPNDLKNCTFCGRCELYCPSSARRVCGEEKTASDIFKKIKADKAFYETSGGGVTFSGGECMLQPELLTELLKMSHDEGIHTAVDTAGNVPFELFEMILPYTDLFLYDLKCFDEKKHINGTGVSNVLILENLKKLVKKGADIIVRVPIIPGFNDSDDEADKMSAYLRELGIKKIELLPYHAMGEAKYSALGMDFTTYNVPTKEKMEHLKNIFGVK